MKIDLMMTIILRTFVYSFFVMRSRTMENLWCSFWSLVLALVTILSQPPMMYTMGVRPEDTPMPQLRASR